jgi:ATP-binding protein involved in chromosome partitioning
MNTVPESLIRQDAMGALRISWPGGRCVDLPYRYLRESCECAHCVHEITGQRLLDPAVIPTDIHIREMKLVGNYALRIAWSDGHDTGLFTWDRFDELARHLDDWITSEEQST